MMSERVKPVADRSDYRLCPDPHASQAEEVRGLPIDLAPHHLILDLGRRGRLTGDMMRRWSGRFEKWFPAFVTLVLSFSLLLPSAISLPQHGDEAQYGWTAAYFTQRLLKLDLRPTGTDRMVDPGWDPLSHWTLTQPMGTRFLYGLVIALARLPTPERPYLWLDPPLPQPENELPAATLLALRLTASLCAAIGLALISYRLKWSGTVAALLFLAFPDVRDALAHAWAEGPLLLGLGLATLAFGSPWFGIMAGLAASFKLTAVLLWPFGWLSRPGSPPLTRMAAVAAAIVTWTLLTPPSWFFGGPLYLVVMLADRLVENAGNARYAPDLTIAGIYWPSHYSWPLDLLLALLVVRGIGWIRQYRRRRVLRGQE
jgi:hypothetical protein